MNNIFEKEEFCWRIHVWTYHKIENLKMNVNIESMYDFCIFRILFTNFFFIISVFRKGFNSIALITCNRKVYFQLFFHFLLNKLKNIRNIKKYYNQIELVILRETFGGISEENFGFVFTSYSNLLQNQYI